MGFMDKAKEAAQQAKVQAQQMAQQGQAKVSAMQQGRTEGELYRALGEAAYAHQRRGGAQEAVDAAVAALDQHYSSAPAPDTDTSGGVTPPAQSPTPGQSPAAPPPGGSFTLNDL